MRKGSAFIDYQEMCLRETQQILVRWNRLYKEWILVLNHNETLIHCGKLKIPLKDYLSFKCENGVLFKSLIQPSCHHTISIYLLTKNEIWLTAYTLKVRAAHLQKKPRNHVSMTMHVCKSVHIAWCTCRCL